MNFGWCGVDLFFVLSGFLITGILLQTRGASNRVQSFFARRVLRVFPLYYLVIAAVFLIGAVSSQLRWITAPNGWPDQVAFILYLQNWLLLRHPLHGVVGHFWSLAVEEQFYLLWPWAVWKLCPKRVLQLCFGGIVSALLLRIFLVTEFGPHFWVNALTCTRGEGLLVGSALAIAANQKGSIPRIILARMAWAGGLILTAIAFIDHREFANTDAGPWMYTAGITGIGLLCGSLVGASSYDVPRLTSFLRQKWLRDLGKYSYGLYVFHVPIYVASEHLLQRAGHPEPLPVAGAIVCSSAMMAISYVVARISYWLIEGRLLALKERYKPKYVILRPEFVSHRAQLKAA